MKNNYLNNQQATTAILSSFSSIYTSKSFKGIKQSIKMGYLSELTKIHAHYMPLLKSTTNPSQKMEILEIIQTADSLSWLYEQSIKK